DLTPPPLPVPFHLVTNPATNSFRFWLILSSAAPAKKIFEFGTGTAGIVFKPATYEATEDEEHLVPASGDVSIVGVAITILIEGQAGEAATMRLSPTDGEPAGIIELQLVPPTVLIGGSGFGLEFPGSTGAPGAFVIDDSTEASPAVRTILNGAVIAT